MGKDDETWLKICYIAFAGVIAYVVYKAISAVGLQFGISEKYDDWFPTVTNLLAVVIGGGTAYWMQTDSERREYHLSAVNEVRKVTWPSIPDTKKMTIIVCVVVAIFSVILAVFDVLWSKILQMILP